MASSRDIPASKASTSTAQDDRRRSLTGSFLGGHRDSIHDLATSFVASFTDPSPIAQLALARDLAEASDSEGDGDEYDDDGEGDDDGLGEDEDDNGDESPYLYRRPSGIAFAGTARPAMTLAPLEHPELSREEKQQSRDAERSLLRDNHILPPKHPIVERPSLAKHLYHKVFSTKLPVRHPDEESHDRGHPTESSPLLPDQNRRPSTIPEVETPGEHLNELWVAAVEADHIKTTWQREAMTIATYSRSLVVTFLLQYSISITSIFAVGRIGKLELGAVSLAVMTGNVTYWAPVQGLATCLDTLCSQAFGSGHKTLVGLQYQRMVAFLLLAVLPMAVVWWNAAAVLAQLIPERQSAELAGQYLRVLVIGMPPFIFFECGKRFVNAQGLFQATTYVLLIAAPTNVFLNWLFVWHLGYGFLGAAYSMVCTQYLMPTLLLFYVSFIDGSQCWGGLSRRMFSNWGPMIRLAIPGMIMVEAEFFAFEILTLASGQFGTAELAAQTVLGTITSTTYQIPFPISVAASTRVANLIGAKLPDAAKTCARVAVVIGVLIGFVLFTFVTTLRWHLPRLFTADEEVIAAVATAMPVVAVMQLFDGICAVSHGLLRGVGRQEIGGYANLLTYYVIALPISFATAFGLGWKLAGLWFGVSIGLLLVSLVEYAFLYRYDWNLAVKDAERRNASG